MRRQDPKDLLMLWVDDQVQLDSRTKYILDKFARFADANGQGWAPVAVLAERTNSSERTVQYALRRLEAEGLIRRTGEEHVVNPGSRFPRKVPLYQFAPGVPGVDPGAPMVAARSGAKLAPEAALGCKAEPAGVQTVAPLNELKGTNSPSGEGETRAREREALFDRLYEAYPKRGRGFTNRDQARAEFFSVIERGVDAELLIQAAGNWAEDKRGKHTDLGLQYWLKDSRFNGFWPEPKLSLGDGGPRPASRELEPGAAPAVDQTLWVQALGEMRIQMGEEEFGAYLRPAFLGLHDGRLYVVALTATARQRIAERRWRQLQTAWANADARRRPLELVSKGQFEALRLRQSEGVK